MRKLLSVLLAAIMIVASFGVMAAAEEAPFVITVHLPYYADVEPVGCTGEEGNPLLEKIEEELNVDLQITWAPQGDYTTKFNTVMSSDDQPMVMVINSGITTNANYIQMCKDGAFWDLTDYITGNEFIMSELASVSSLAITSVEGRNYLFPSMAAAARVGILYRADWIEALNAKGYNLVVPNDIETFKAMVQAFTEGDPDGNGVDDTIGFAYCDNKDNELTYAGFNTLAVMNGAPNYWGEDENGDLMPYFFFDEYVETLDLFNWMYVNGYMNTDFAINTDKHGPLANGVSGSMITTATNAAGTKYANVVNVHPNAVIKQNQDLFNVYGEQTINSVLSVGGLGGILIPTSSVKDAETVQKIIDFIVALNDQGGIYLACGVEDLHWTRNEDGTISVSEEQKQLRQDDGSSEVFASMFPRRVQSLDYGQGLSATQEITAHSLSIEKFCVVDESIGYMSDASRALQTEIATIISDARVAYMSGTIDAEGFEAARQEWLAAGGQQIIDQVNESYHAAN
ncbi:MAG: extracellular solute-binding protein [Clostridia bacterium]|nr:extracellular solute-binding protein [Clostridia bacterium]